MLNKFIIFVPYCTVYEPYIVQCLSSIEAQDYTNYEIVIVNDGAKTVPFQSKYTVLNFDENKGPGFSKWTFINHIQTNMDKYSIHDIAIIVDGDDYLSDTRALSIINERYNATNCWVTFGNAVGPFIDPDCKNIFNNLKVAVPRKRMIKYTDTQDITSVDIRNATWVFTHPRTFKLFLLLKLVEDNFKMGGEWLRKNTDRQLIYNCVEWAGLSKCEYIGPVIYNYREHSLNSFKTHKQEYIMKTRNYTQNQPPQQQIEDIHIVLCVWKRLQHLPKQLDNLNEQTVSYRIVLHILNNNPDTLAEVETIILGENRIRIRLSHYNNEYAGFQRFFYIRDNLLSNRHVIIIDDDQLFAVDWVEKMYALRLPKTYTAWYIKRWDKCNDDKCNDDKCNICYWKGSSIMIYDCEKGTKRNIRFGHYGATCGSIIDTTIFRVDSNLWDIPSDVPVSVYYGVEDLWLSYILQANEWSIARSFLPPICDITATDKEANSVSMCLVLRKEKQLLLEYLMSLKGWQPSLHLGLARL